MSLARVIVVLAVLLGLAGCGGDRIITQTVTRTVAIPPPSERATKAPSLAAQAPGPGEILVNGNTAPKTFGPYDFEPGVYKFQYEQFAPDTPGLNFKTDASPLAVMINRKPRVTAADSQLIVNASERTGDNLVEISGRFYVDVTSADHSYVLRFTPQR